MRAILMAFARIAEQRRQKAAQRRLQTIVDATRESYAIQQYRQRRAAALRGMEKARG